MHNAFFAGFDNNRTVPNNRAWLNGGRREGGGGHVLSLSISLGVCVKSWYNLKYNRNLNIN